MSRRFLLHPLHLHFRRSPIQEIEMHELNSIVTKKCTGDWTEIKTIILKSKKTSLMKKKTIILNLLDSLVEANFNRVLTIGMKDA